MPIDCFDKHYPRAKQQFTDRIKDGMSELEQRQEGLKIAEELQKQLNDDVNAFKQKIGKDPKEYKSTDKSAKVEGIKSEYDTKIKELSSPKTKTDGKDQKSSTEKSSQENASQKGNEKGGTSKGDVIVPPTRDDLTPIIKVGGKEYTGYDHGEAMKSAIAAGEKIPSPDTPEGKKWRMENGMFKDNDGNLLTRDQTQDKYGISHSEQLLPGREVPIYARNVSALITPATVRAFDKLTARMKKMSVKYDELVAEMNKKPSDKILSKIRTLERQILGEAKKEIVAAIEKIKGVGVMFKDDNMGSWHGTAEPSLNMFLKIEADADTQALSDFIHEFGEKYSQDAIILETQSEHHNDVISGKKDIPLSDFDGKFLHYPQKLIKFAKDLTADQIAKLSNSLRSKGVNEFSLNSKELKVSIITELSDEQKKLSDDEQYKIKLDDYNSKNIATSEAVNALGSNGGVEQTIRYRKSKYEGGKTTGEGGQQRKYDRSDIFKDFSEEVKDTQVLGKELGILRDKQISLQEKGKDLTPKEKERLDELTKKVQPIVEETFQTREREFEKAKEEVESIAAKAIKGIQGFVSKFPIKRATRASVKTLRWYSADPSKLGDAARVNIIAPDLKTSNEVFNKINKENAVDADLRRINEPTDLGYPKRLIEVRTSSGAIAEIQVMTPEGYLAKDGVKDFPEAERGFAKKQLDKIREKLGWNIPDGVGHYFYEINRDFNVPENIREEAKRLSNQYYDAMLRPEESKISGEQFQKDLDKFRESVDKADKTGWDTGNEGKIPETAKEFLKEKVEKSEEKQTALDQEDAVDHEDPLQVSLQRDALIQRVQDEFFKPENGSRSIGDDVVMNGAIKTLSREAVDAGKSILNHLADKVKKWDNELFNPTTGERRVDGNGRFVQKVLTDEELAMLGVHSLELEKKIREAKFEPGVEMDNAALGALLGEQEQLQRLTAAVTEAAGRGFRFIQQIYSFGDKGEYNLHVKLAEQLVGSKIPLDEAEFKSFKESLPKGQQKVAQVAHDAITALKAKYDEIEKKRDKIQKNKAKIDAEEINKQTTAGVNQSKTSDVEDGDKTKNTTKSGKIKKSSAVKVSDRLDKLADFIENKNLLGGNLPEGTQAMGVSGGQNFSKAVAESIRRIAQKIRNLEGKIPDLIDDEVKLLIKDGHDEKQAREAIKNQLKQAGIEDEAINATPKREDLINKIVEHSKNAKTPNKLSKESVKKNLVKQLAVEVALRGEPVESVPEKVISLLKEKGIELDRNQYNDAFLRQGEFKLSRSNDLANNAKKLSKELTESEKLFTEMEKLDEQIASVQDTGTIDKDKKDIPEKVIVPKLAEKESQLKEAMIKKGIKFERGSKDSQAAKRGVLAAHNESVERFGDKITKMLDNDAFGDKNVEGLKDFLRGLQKKLSQKVDATNLDTHIKEASLKVEKAINEFNRDWFKAEKRGDKSMQEVLDDLNKLHRDIESNAKKSAEKIALDRFKKRMNSEIDEYNRKKNAGEFDDTKGVTELKKDADAYRLEDEKELAKVEFMRALDAYKNEKAKDSTWGKIYLFVHGVRSVTGRMIVSGLGNIQAKLIGSSATRRVTPLSRALAHLYTKRLGLEGSVVQQSTNSKAMWRGYKETIIGSSEKKAMAAIEKSRENVYAANDKLAEAQDKYRELIESGDKEAANKFKNTELAKARNEYNLAAMDDSINFMYTKMHTNPWRGRAYIFEKGLSKQEEDSGMFGKRESIGDVMKDNSPVDFGNDTNKFNAAVKKTGSRVSKIIRAGLFYANMTTRSHSVWKDIPARQAMVEGYMKRLEKAQNDGEDISNYEVKARLWHEAVATDGQEAKFQDKNKAVDITRDIQSAIGKGILKAGGNEYAAKTVDELAYMTTQVLKVPMNIAKVKVFQYGLGTIMGTFDALAQRSNAKKAGLGFAEYMKTIDPKYSDRIINSLAKGTVGIASSILVGAMTMNGQYVSGGSYPDPKKKNVPTNEGPQDLEYGDIVILGHKLPHLLAVAWGHTPLGYTMEMGNFITEEAMKAGDKGESFVERWMDGLMEAGKATISEVPLIIPIRRERDYKTGETVMRAHNPFASLGYFGAVKDIESGYQNLVQSPEERTKYAKTYQMSTMEGIFWRSGMLWMVPTQDEAEARKATEEAEKENRAQEFKSNHPNY